MAISLPCQSLFTEEHTREQDRTDETMKKKE
jgi:hypothetical protein